MKYLNHFYKSITNISINESMVHALYTMSKTSMFALLVLASFTVLSLFSELHMAIVIWYILLLIVIFFRLHDVNTYTKHKDKFTLIQWHKRFFYISLLTALIYSSLGFIFIHNVDMPYKFLIIFMMIGISSGSITSLSTDLNLSILYTTTLLFPLVISILLMDSLPIHYIIFCALILFFIVQLVVIKKTFLQKKELFKLESENSILDKLFKNSPFGAFVYDNNLTLLDCNDKLSQILDNDKKNMIGINLKDLPDKRPLSIFENPFSSNTNTYVGPYISLKGKEFWMEAKALTFDSTRDEFFRGIGIIEDKTKEHNAINKLEYLVKHDVLTKLLNRRGYTNAINSIINSEKHNNHYSILFYLDLNQFKSINDSLGHEIGDAVLLLVSERLKETMDANDIVCRIGGDEFVCIIPHIATSIEDITSIASEIGDKIQKIFSTPFIIKEMNLNLSASTGIIFIKPNDMNTEEILRHADLTMYQAKNNNLSISYYDSSLDAKQRKLFILQQELGHARDNDELKLYLQPILDMRTDALHAAELLIRWEHPTSGVLSPDKFIPLAIKAGLLSSITWWLLDNVCKQISQWKEEGKWTLQYISVNINPHQLLEHNFVDDLLDKLSKYSIKNSEIILEITERSLIDNFEQTQDIITQLKDKGVQCAIDDFGIGYSSLSYLKRLSLHTLKIDREFVKDIGKDPNELVLMQTILDIGRQFDYSIIIEGIENKEQIEALINMDNKLYYQGYLYSKPLNIEDFTTNIL